MKFKEVIKTGGDGLWSSVAKLVTCTKITVSNLLEDDESFDNFGELKVYFTKTSWDVKKYGLIYTDDQFLRILRKRLNKYKLDGTDIDYSEQGMQGYTYVSLDVGPNFLKSWEKLNEK